VIPFKQSALSGQVIAYYTNDYQRYAIEQLTKDGRLEQWSCLHDLWTRESNWRPEALNKTSTAAQNAPTYRHSTSLFTRQYMALGTTSTIS
jgi:hypothetical protein